MGDALQQLKEQARALSRAEQLDLIEDLLQACGVWLGRTRPLAIEDVFGSFG